MFSLCTGTSFHDITVKQLLTVCFSLNSLYSLGINDGVPVNMVLLMRGVIADISIRSNLGLVVYVISHSLRLNQGLQSPGGLLNSIK